MEIWKPIYGYEGIYSVSNFARIRGEKFTFNNTFKPGRILKPSPTKYGYLRIKLCKNKTYIDFYIAHLVSETFIGPKPHGLEINHKDGNKSNNHVDNLEYITHSDNLKHAYKTGLFKNHKPFPKGENNFKAKLTEKDVLEIREKYKQKISIRKLSELYKVSWTQIDYIIKRKNWKHI